MKSLKLLGFSLLLAISGCGNLDANATSNWEDGNRDKLSNLDSSFFLDLLKKYEKVCSPSDSFASCPLKKVALRPNIPGKSSEGQRILILDGFGVPRSAYSFNKKKLIGALKQNERGVYDDYSPYAKLPIPLLEVANRAYEGAILDPLQLGQMFGELPDILRQLFGRTVIKHEFDPASTVNYFYHHGERIFEWLSYYNPDAQFVVAPHPQLIERQGSLFCRSARAKNIEDIATFYRTALHSLGEYIEHYRVSHVNVSWRSTWEMTKRDISRNCSMAYHQVSDDFVLGYMDIQKQFIVEMASTHSVKVFWAMPNDMQGGHEQEDIIFDLPENVFQVGYFSTVQRIFGRDGVRTDSDQARLAIPTNQQRIARYADLMINGGIDEGKFDEFDVKYAGDKLASQAREEEKWWDSESLLFIRNGVYLEPIDGMATSWATPLALSLALFIERQSLRGGDFSFDESTDVVRKKVVGRLFDPIANRQFQRFYK